MAKKLYEEENMREIADAIRHFGNTNRGWTTAQMPNGIEDVYLEGYNVGDREGYDVGYSEGYSAGLAEGGEGGLNPLVCQAQSPTVHIINNTMYAYPLSTYGIAYNYDYTFDELVEREISSASSNPLTVSVDNYSNYYLYLYVRATDLGNDEGLLSEIVVPPNMNNSVDFVSLVGMGNPVDWQVEVLGARFTKYEL